MKPLSVICIWLGVLFLIFGLGESAMAFIGFFATIAVGLWATAVILSEGQQSGNGPTGSSNNMPTSSSANTPGAPTHTPAGSPDNDSEC